MKITGHSAESIFDTGHRASGGLPAGSAVRELAEQLG